MKKTIKLLGIALCMALALASCKKAEVPQTVSITPTKLEFTSTFTTTSSGTKTITVTSNAEWTATKTADWITVNPTTGAAGDTKVEITVTKNVEVEGKCSKARSSEIVFAVKDAKATLSISQLGEELTISARAIPESPKFDCKGGSFPVEVFYNSEYTVNSSADWLTFTKDPESKLLTYDDYTCTVAENKTFEARKATLTFTSGDQTSSIEVNQEAKPKGLPDKSTALSGEFTVNPYGKKVKFSKGNLYWDGETFCFEDNQITYNTAETYDAKHVSNFYWSDNAAISYAETFAWHDVPYQDATFFADKIHEDWTTLSGAEWKYLIEHHKGNRKSVIADGIAGVVFAPDGITEEVPETFTADEWKAAEKKGYIFLPVTGTRKGSKINSPKSAIDYWSSTYYKKVEEWDNNNQPTGKMIGAYYCASSVNGEYGPNEPMTVNCPSSNSGEGIRLVTVSNPGGKPEALPGTFTVNAEGKKVQFSPGNLWWGQGTFDFEATQYDFSRTYSFDHISHFFWTTDPYLSWEELYTSDGVDVKTVQPSDFFANKDAVMGSEWTVLTAAEWDYILANHKKTNRASVNGVYCTLIAPDGVTDVPESSYEGEAWTAAQQAGIIAIPAASYRDQYTDEWQLTHSKVYDEYIGSTGYYWTGEFYRQVAADAYWMKTLWQNIGNPYWQQVNTGNGFVNTAAVTVRMVKVVK